MALQKDPKGVPATPAEDMFSTSDNRSLRRGRRRAPRTEVCRPCLIWVEGREHQRFQGVMLDLNPHGMKVRMLESLPKGALVALQMMRDEEFQVPLSPPIRGEVMRLETDPAGFVDHGIRVRLSEIKRPVEIKPVRLERRRTLPHVAGRMHTVDYTVGERGTRRSGRGRG